MFDPSTDELLIVGCFVDDFIMASSSDRLTDKFISFLSSRLPVKDLGFPNEYVGLSIKATSTGYYVNQRRYLEDIVSLTGLENGKPVDSPVNDISPVPPSAEDFPRPDLYRTVVGKLSYVATHSRPDLAYAASVSSRYCLAPKVQHWNRLKRVARYILGTLDQGLHFRFGTTSFRDYKPEITTYTDATWADDVVDRSSTSGCIIYLNGTPVNWFSKRQKCYSLSSCESELISISVGLTETIWCRDLISSLIPTLSAKDISVTLKCDNQSAISASLNPSYQSRLRHVLGRQRFVNQRLEMNGFKLIWTSTDTNVADLCTKGSSGKFYQDNLSRILVPATSTS
jgi:hypothetical protein